MGCGASKEEIAAFEAMRDRCGQLELDCADLEQNILTLEKQIVNNEGKSKEQLNLYRFKIEVMANMLSVEEKKLSATVKRLETLKLAMLTQGFTDKAMNTLLRTKSTPGNKKDNDQNILMTSAFDMSGAITRLTGEMESHPEDVIYAFANKQGKVLSHVSREDFARYLYNATETLTKSDVQVLSLRFFDGSTVCVPEFIDFFTSSSSTRVARAAAAAVRVSLNMLQLEVVDVEDKESYTEVEEINLVKDPSTNMKTLQLAVDKLLAIWMDVEESLIDEFMNIEEEIGGNQIVQFDTFEEVLDTCCGNAKVVEERKNRRATRNKWLTAEDINFIACRFEIGDRIDVKQFFNFFQDAFYSSNSEAPAAAPFQFSKEWSTLKHSAQQDLVSGNTRGKKKKEVDYTEDNPAVDDKEVTEFDEEKTVEPKPKPKPKPSQSPTKQKAAPAPAPAPVAVPKPTLTKTKSEKPPIASKSAPVNDVPVKTEQPEPKTVAPPPTKVFDNTLVALYASDPDSFENKLEKMSGKTGFIMTKEEFRVTLKNHTEKEKIPDSDIDGVLNKLRFVGGTCSVSDLVELLAASVNAAKTAPPPVVNNTPTNTAATPLGLVSQGPFVNVRQQHILDTLVTLREAELDVISTQHQTNPKVFLATLKESSINNKTGVVDGTGNSITSASFNQVMRKLVPQARKTEVDTLEQELQPSIRKDTSDILLTAITSNLKLRTKEFNSTASNIKKQEKLLAEEEKRNVRIEERTVKVNELTTSVQTDSISDHYFLDPKLFMTNLKTNRIEKTMLMTDLTEYFKDYIPKIKKAENDKFRADLLEADKKLNAQDQNLQVSFAAVEKLLKQRLTVRTKLLKQIENEKKVLQKDVDKASTVTDAGGGCCGGGGGNVHDPNTSPQDLPPDAKNKEDQTAKGVPKDNNSNPDSNTNNSNSNGNGNNTSEPKGRGRSSSDANANDQHSSLSSDGDNDDIPRYDPNSVSINSNSSSKGTPLLTTADTLTYSDNGDDKSDDSGGASLFDRRGEDKPKNRRQMHERRGGHGTPKNESFANNGSQRGGFGKPRDIDRALSDIDASDDDSLIFGSMKKK